MICVSWADIDGMVDVLVPTLSRQRFDVIVGISRSGLVPAVMLSHSLSIRQLTVLDIRRTESDSIDAAKHPPAFTGAFNEASLRNSRVLLVDDIMGEGATMAAAKAYVAAGCASLTTAALVVNLGNCHVDPLSILDVFACAVHDWVVFPWEGKHDLAG